MLDKKEAGQFHAQFMKAFQVTIDNQHGTFSQVIATGLYHIVSRLLEEVLRNFIEEPKAENDESPEPDITE